jgi:hypothetical protein
LHNFVIPFYIFTILHFYIDIFTAFKQLRTTIEQTPALVCVHADFRPPKLEFKKIKIIKSKLLSTKLELKKIKIIKSKLLSTKLELKKIKNNKIKIALNKIRIKKN